MRQMKQQGFGEGNMNGNFFNTANMGGKDLPEDFLRKLNAKQRPKHRKGGMTPDEAMDESFRKYKNKNAAAQEEGEKIEL
jgi:hypothetical protein